MSQTVTQDDKEMFAASAFSIIVDDQDMLEYFLNYPAVNLQHPFSLDYKCIAFKRIKTPHFYKVLQAIETSMDISSWVLKQTWFATFQALWLAI